MSGMDRLTAIERLRLHIDEDFSAPDLSDLLEEIEVLEEAHRRASQAAPAPSDGLREADRSMLAMLMANAPVTQNPESYLKDFIERIDTDVITEMLGRPALTHPGLISRDEELAFGEMLRRALDYAVEQCAALTPAPAQNGGGPLTDRQLRDQITGEDR